MVTASEKFRVTFATLGSEGFVATLARGGNADEATTKARDDLAALGYPPERLGEVERVERVVTDEHGDAVFEAIA